MPGTTNTRTRRDDERVEEPGNGIPRDEGKRALIRQSPVEPVVAKREKKRHESPYVKESARKHQDRRRGKERSSHKTGPALKKELEREAAKSVNGDNGHKPPPVGALVADGAAEKFRGPR